MQIGSKCMPFLYIVGYIIGGVAIGVFIVHIIIRIPTDQSPDDNPRSLSGNTIFYYTKPTLVDAKTRGDLSEYNPLFYKGTTEIYNHGCSQGFDINTLRRCRDIDKQIKNFTYDDTYAYAFGQRLSGSSSQTHLPLGSLFSWDSQTQQLYIGYTPLSIPGLSQIDYFQIYGNSIFIANGETRLFGTRYFNNGQIEQMTGGYSIDVVTPIQGKDKEITFSYFYQQFPPVDGSLIRDGP